MSFNSPISTTLPGSPSPLPMGSLPGGSGSPFGSTLGLGFDSAHQTAIEQAIHNSPDLAGIWDTIKNAGGDVWSVIGNLLPKNPDGSINWGGIGKDVFGFIKDNGSGILKGLNAINSYQRQGKSDAFAQQALDLAKQSYAERAPLRAAGQAGMLDPHAGTPDLTNLAAQGQKGLSLAAPTPVPAPQVAYQNAAKVAGPQSGNPFASALPLAPAPVSSAPAGPSGPPSPSGPSGPGRFTPQAPHPLPVGTQPPQGVSPVPPVATPQALQLASQSGAIKNGPQNRQLPSFPPNVPQYGLSPLPLAG